MTVHPSPPSGSALRRRMIEDMTVRGFTEKTQHDYIRCVKTFAAFLGRSPDRATAEDPRRFQVHQMQAGLQLFPWVRLLSASPRYWLKSRLVLDRSRFTPDEMLGDGLIVWVGGGRFRTQRCGPKLMASDFIFMLTHTDRTIPDAADRVPDALRAGVRHIGFKDIGLPFARLRCLADTIQAAGATLYLEVVSLDAQSEETSARAAVELGVDVLMGGTRPEVVLPVLAGTGIRYYPFPGQVVGHPSILVGTSDAIVESARQLAAMDGVHGLDLLAYRFQGDGRDLIGRVCRAVATKPVVVAGSIDCPARIAAVIAAGAAGFTVGTAALDGVFPARSSALADQLAFIVQRASSP